VFLAVHGGTISVWTAHDRQTFREVVMLARACRLALACALAATVLLAIPTAAAAAAGSRGAALREALDGLDPALLATGRLHDRAIPLAGLRARDGSAAAPPADAAVWRQMLGELRDASLSPPAWPDPAAVRARMRALHAAGRVPIGVIDLAYETLRPDALARGLLAIEAGRFVAGPEAAAGDLFERRRAFAAAALTPRLFHGRAARFVVPGDLVIADEPATLAIDFADGAGFRAVAPGAEVLVSYAETGVRRLSLRAVTPGGEVRLAAFTVEVVALETPAPTETWPLTATIPYDGAVATGEAFVYLAEGHAAVTDPVVVVEGFDLDNSLGWPELYALLNQENLLEDLRAQGRDAVILDFTEATDPIQRNAFLLVELMATLRAQLAPGATFPVVGASMGGLVARYALAWLEAQNETHAVSTFIAFDSPQNGADIPLGLQAWLVFFQGESEEAAFLLSRLDTPAARQMLVYHHAATSGSTAASDPLRAALDADLAALGGWPTGPRLVAVTNGGGQGAGQGYPAGVQLILYEYESFLVDITGNVWAVPDGTSQLIFDGMIDLVWPLPDSYSTLTVAGTEPYDSGPGGFRASLAQMDTTAVPYGDIVALHDNHAFVPTISALDLATSDPFFDIAGQPDLPALTPYDAVYVPAANQEHVLVTPENKVWLLAELAPPATAVEPGPAAALRLAAAPNPFNPRTELSFSAPRADGVVLEVIDLRGRRVRTLVDGAVPPGPRTARWDGADDAGRPVAAGVYFARLAQGGSAITTRLVLVR